MSDEAKKAAEDYEKEMSLVDNSPVVEFLSLLNKFMGHLPPEFAIGKLPFSDTDRLGYMNLIGSIMYGRDQEVFNIVKSDALLAKRIWYFLMDSWKVICPKFLLLVAQNTSRSTLNKQIELVTATLEALMNFTAATLNSISAEEYVLLMDDEPQPSTPKPSSVLQKSIYEGHLDQFEFSALLYSIVRNLTVNHEVAQLLVHSEHLSLKKLVDRTRKYDYTHPRFLNLIHLITNLTVVSSVVCELFNEKLTELTEDQDSENPNDEVYVEYLMRAINRNSPAEVRIAISSLFMNSSMFTEVHGAILSESKDILSHLVEPLVMAGTYKEEEMLELPNALYGVILDNNVVPDPNLTVRSNIISALYQLCKIRSSRESLRSQGIYYILREYDLWETDDHLKSTLGEVVNLLIQTEDEIGVDDLRTVNLDEKA